MTRRLDRNINSYDDPFTPTEIALNTSTYTKLLDSNEDRISYTLSNLSQQTIIVREKAFGDNLERGFAVFGRTVYTSETDQIPHGEIHALAKSGSPSVLVTEQ